MAMNPSFTSRTSRKAMATMVAPNPPSTSHANSGSGSVTPAARAAVSLDAGPLPAPAGAVRNPYRCMMPRVRTKVTMRIGNEEGRPCCQMKSRNSAPDTLWSICGGRSPSSSAVPMKLALKPIMSTTGVRGKPSCRTTGMATGASIRITTTLSTTMDSIPASMDRMNTSSP